MLPPGIISILGNQRTGTVEYTDDVPLPIVNVVVIGRRAAIFVLEPIPLPILIIQIR